MSQLDQILSDLKQARTDAELCAAEKKAILDDAMATGNYRLADEAHGKAKAQIENLEAIIRKAALDEFKATGNKAVHPSVTVKIFKVFNVIDKDRLRDWCFRNLPVVLQPDVKKVEAYVKDLGGSIEGAELTEEARAQIATKL